MCKMMQNNKYLELFLIKSLNFHRFIKLMDWCPSKCRDILMLLAKKLPEVGKVSQLSGIQVYEDDLDWETLVELNIKLVQYVN